MAICAKHLEQARRTWNDTDEAAEHGAYGVAALLVDKLTDYTVWERAKKGKGYDFWLRRKGDQGGVLLQGAARMEVSVIGPGSGGQFACVTSQPQEQADGAVGCTTSRRSRRRGLPSSVHTVEVQVNELETLHRRAMSLAEEAEVEAAAGRARRTRQLVAVWDSRG